jgi:hypothetical protein
VRNAEPLRHCGSHAHRRIDDGDDVEPLAILGEADRVAGLADQTGTHECHGQPREIFHAAPSTSRAG